MSGCDDTKVAETVKHTFSKRCGKCGDEKSLECFGLSKFGRHGRRSTCRQCRANEYQDTRKRRRCACGEVPEFGSSKCSKCITRDLPPPGYRTCPRCKCVKHFNAFPSDSSRKDGLFSYCKFCHREYQSEWMVSHPSEVQQRRSIALERAAQWRRENQEVYKEMNRRRGLLQRYGITPEQYGLKLEEQGGTCAFCNRTPADELHGVLAVDHDHSCCDKRSGCGVCFRFLLCFRCNAMIGLAGDDSA